MKLVIEPRKKREVQVKFRCFESENEAINRLCEKKGVSKSHLIRFALKKIMPKEIDL